jgi:hypothetical protein
MSTVTGGQPDYTPQALKTQKKNYPCREKNKTPNRRVITIKGSGIRLENSGALTKNTRWIKTRKMLEFKL